MQTLAPQVEAKLRRLFNGDGLNGARELLQRFGAESWHKEVDRVQMAILWLTKDDPATLEHVVGQARKDYRDILVWAECPYDMELNAEPSRALKRKKTVHADEYRKWVEES